MANNKTNTTASVTAADILALADDPSMQNVCAYHELWELVKKELPRESTYLWNELSTRSVERKIGRFAGKKFFAAHPEYTPSTPAWAGKPKASKDAADPNPPAKQEKPKAKAKVKAPEAPAKQEKPKAKAPTQKEMLANMLATLEQMDKRHAETAKRLDAIEASIAGINAELKGTGKRLNAIDKKLAK